MDAGARFDGDPDLTSESNVQDPFPLFAWLRRRDPVHWSESLGGWVVTRYADVLEVFDRPDRFSSDRFRLTSPRHASERAPVRAVSRVLRDWLVFRDPPDHTRLRALLQKSFTPRQLAKNRWGIQKTIDDLLDRVASTGEMDFIRDFAFPLPALVVCIRLGVPTRDVASVKRASDRHRVRRCLGHRGEPGHPDHLLGSAGQRRVPVPRHLPESDHPLRPSRPGDR
jgi:cytochrome P450